MNRDLVLDIGSLRIDVTGRIENPERLETVLREGLEDLAQRLEASAFTQGAEAAELVFAQLEISDLSIEQLTGGRGAALIGEQLFTRLTTSGAGR